MKKIEIHPLKKFKTHKIAVPGSKSYSNRALLVAALADGESTLTNLLLSDDTKVMLAALKELGVKYTLKGTTIKVKGCKGKFKKPKKELYFENAGTAVRFMTAALAMQDFESTVTGNERMQERPIKPLVDALIQGGAKIEYLRKEGYPPLRIKGGFKGGKITVPGGISSQYVSSILMISPYSEIITDLQIKGNVVSKPYIDMTIQVIKSFGVTKGKRSGYKRIAIKNGIAYKGTKYKVEADASAASYFFALGAIHGVEMKVTNAKYNSAQGDIKFVDILKKSGCKVEIGKTGGIKLTGPEKLKCVGQPDMNPMPDVALTMAIVAAFTEGKTRLSNIPNLRVKECDRILAMTTELNKINCKARQMAEGIEIKGHPHKYHGAEIHTYDDHRIAMCFGVLGTMVPGIIITDPDCVSKTYPNFWKDLKKLGVKITKV